MKYLIPGVLAGVLLACIPFLQPHQGMEIYPEWVGTMQSLRTIELSGNPLLAGGMFPPVVVGNVVHIIKGSGEHHGEYDFGEKRAAVSGNGKYIVEYEKVGSSIEFINLSGERFWKLPSLEYPYLSHSGKLILLMNGDHSRVRIADVNGNIIGEKSVSGRLCTTISFAKTRDFAAVGFLDGSYYAVNKKGKVILKGRVPGNAVVKGIALSDTGTFCAVHYGTTEKDHVRIVDVREGDTGTLPLKYVHLARTALHCDERGNIAVLDRNRLVFADSDGDIDLSLNTPEAKTGHARIDSEKGIYALTYSLKSGGAQFVLVRDDGNVLYSKGIPEESFLDCRLEPEGNAIFLRGAQTLMCYSLHFPESE